MAIFKTFSLVIATTVFFFEFVPLSHLFDALQTITTSLSIAVAALLVRLNRGMPTLDWKNVDVTARSRLTAEILSIVKDYVNILAVLAFFLVLVLTVFVVGKQSVQVDFVVPWLQLSLQRLVSGSIGGLLALSVLRMGQVVWRDYDIVRLQKEIIDSSAASDRISEQQKSAAGKLADIRASGLKKVDTSPPDKWGSS